MTRVLVIGLDGADFELIHPWVREGRLPNLARLMERGVSGPLRSTVPPMSPPAWTSFMTGKNPGKHGIFDFTVRRPHSYQVGFVSGRYRRAPTLWRLMSDAGRRVGVLGVPITWPPESLNGVMITGLDTPATGGLADTSAFSPPELHAEIMREVGGYLVSPNFESFDSSQSEEIVEAAFRSIDSKMATAAYLLRREAWDFFMVVAGETDGIAHRLWKYHDPTSPLADAAARRYAGPDPILQVYERVDAHIGTLLSLVEPDVPVVVMSDHGNGPNGRRAVYLNRWLAQHGFLTFAREGDGWTPRQVLRRLSGAEALRRAVVRMLPASLKRRIFRGTNLAGKMQSWLRFNHIDWSGTQAYSEETPYFPTIWLNVRGREPGGVVPADDYHTVRERLVRDLTEWTDPATGRRVLRQVHRREELYSGPYVEQAPDLILEWDLDDQRHSYLFKRSPGPRGETIVTLGAADLARAKSGDHRDHGIFIAAGGPFRAGARVDDLSIVDLVPMLLYMLDVPVPLDVDGRVPAEVFRDATVLDRGPVWVEAPVAHFADDGAGYSREEEEAIRARLQGLGYIE